jgi:hypothetical protein
MKEFLNKKFVQCTADMREAAESGKWTLDAQVRVYDLLETLMDLDNVKEYTQGSEVAAEFCSEYEVLADRVRSSYDESSLRMQIDDVLKSLKEAVTQAEQRVYAAADLHECAKETYEIWQNAGYFARRKALRILRQKAGFRLETKRIGNYVARTFDLLNLARTDYAHAQQTLFAADPSYKIKSDLHARIMSLITGE